MMGLPWAVVAPVRGAGLTSLGHHE
jgi:hypothetical protein